MAKKRRAVKKRASAKRQAPRLVVEFVPDPRMLLKLSDMPRHEPQWPGGIKHLV